MIAALFWVLGAAAPEPELPVCVEVRVTVIVEALIRRGGQSAEAAKKRAERTFVECGSAQFPEDTQEREEEKAL